MPIPSMPDIPFKLDIVDESMVLSSTFVPSNSCKISTMQEGTEGKQMAGSVRQII